MNPRHLPLVPLGAAVVASIALAGCAVGSPAASSASATSQASTGADPSTDTASPDTASEASETPRPQSTAAPELGQPVARKTITRQSNQFTLAIYQPTRERDLVTLVFDLTLDKFAGDTLDGDLLTDPDNLFAKVDRVPNTLRLLDPAGHKLYLPATTGDGQDTALCSPHGPSSGESKQGDTYTFSCVYAGVPTSLTNVTLRSASFGSIPGVTIR